MHSNLSCKIRICSAILGKLSLFEITRASIFRFNLKFYESKNFFESSLHHIFKSENFRFPTKNSLLGSAMRKIKLEKILGNLLDKLRKLCMNGVVILKFFSLPQAIGNFWQFLLLRTESSQWVPLTFLRFQVLSCSWTGLHVEIAPHGARILSRTL